MANEGRTADPKYVHESKGMGGETCEGCLDIVIAGLAATREVVGETTIARASKLGGYCCVVVVASAEAVGLNHGQIDGEGHGGEETDEDQCCFRWCAFWWLPFFVVSPLRSSLNDRHLDLLNVANIVSWVKGTGDIITIECRRPSTSPNFGPRTSPTFLMQ